MTTRDWYQADDDDSDRARSNTAVWRDRGAIIAQQQARIAQLEAQVARVEALADEWIGFGMCALYESPLEIGQMVRDALMASGSNS